MHIVSYEKLFEGSIGLLVSVSFTWRQCYKPISSKSTSGGYKWIGQSMAAGDAWVILVFQSLLFLDSPSTSVDAQNKELLLVKVDSYMFRISTKSWIQSLFFLLFENNGISWIGRTIVQLANIYIALIYAWLIVAIPSRTKALATQLHFMRVRECPLSGSSARRTRALLCHYGIYHYLSCFWRFWECIELGDKEPNILPIHMPVLP